MFTPIFISVPSQVIVGRTISKKQMLMSVSTKIAIQLNCKLGGEAWALEIPVSVGFFQSKTPWNCYEHFVLASSLEIKG